MSAARTFLGSTIGKKIARPVGYREWRARESTYASRTMRWSGLFLLAFVVHHLLDRCTRASRRAMPTTT
jgi:hypothetical protein